MMQKPGDRRLSDRDLFLPESVFEFGQRDVRLLSYQLPHQILMRRQREIFVAAEFGRLDAARLPVKLEEADDRTDADAALLRSFRDGGPALNRPDHSPTQILRIRLRHACWPPPSRHLESCSRRYGNPRVSLLGKRSSEPRLLLWRQRVRPFIRDRDALFVELALLIVGAVAETRPTGSLLLQVIGIALIGFLLFELVRQSGRELTKSILEFRLQRGVLV